MQKKKETYIRENQDNRRRSHGVPEGAEESSHSIILYEDLYARLQYQHVSSDRRARLHEQEGLCIVNTLSWCYVRLDQDCIVLHCTLLYCKVRYSSRRRNLALPDVSQSSHTACVLPYPPYLTNVLSCPTQLPDEGHRGTLDHEAVRNQIAQITPSLESCDAIRRY